MGICSMAPSLVVNEPPRMRGFVFAPKNPFDSMPVPPDSAGTPGDGAIRGRISGRGCGKKDLAWDTPAARSGGFQQGRLPGEPSGSIRQQRPTAMP